MRWTRARLANAAVEVTKRAAEIAVAVAGARHADIARFRCDVVLGLERVNYVQSAATRKLLEEKITSK